MISQLKVIKYWVLTKITPGENKNIGWVNGLEITKIRENCYQI